MSTHDPSLLLTHASWFWTVTFILFLYTEDVKISSNSFQKKQRFVSKNRTFYVAEIWHFLVSVLRSPHNPSNLSCDPLWGIWPTGWELLPLAWQNCMMHSFKRIIIRKSLPLDPLHQGMYTALKTNQSEYQRVYKIKIYLRWSVCLQGSGQIYTFLSSYCPMWANSSLLKVMAKV